MRIHKNKISEVKNHYPENGNLVMCKLVGDDFVTYHYFSNDAEVHGWVMGLHDICDNLKYSIEWITVNGEVIK